MDCLQPALHGFSTKPLLPNEFLLIDHKVTRPGVTASSKVQPDSPPPASSVGRRHWDKGMSTLPDSTLSNGTVDICYTLQHIKAAFPLDRGLYACRPSLALKVGGWDEKNTVTVRLSMRFCQSV